MNRTTIRLHYIDHNAMRENGTISPPLCPPLINNNSKLLPSEEVTKSVCNVCLRVPEDELEQK